ncbi:MAG TPA: M48 family metallopeptidase [Pyrinomonadaceae bacterium]|jgi:predicted Zn-dependent protease|nr:M48 family metallopeptidase [Pyrinomonadaceae bacterium]
MLSNPLRKSVAFLAAFSIWFSLVAFVPAAAVAQESDSAKQTAKNDKDTAKPPSKSDTDKKTDTQTNANKPLSTNEDPSQIGKRNINKGFSGWLGGSMEKEMAIGRQVAAEVEQQAKMLDDPIVTEYVNRVGQNIALHSDVKVPVTIKVVDSDEVNAFALPGGFLYVNKGLLLAADNESELAGVMAHELGHVAARHAMENAGKARLINYGMLAGIIFGGGIVGNILYNGGGLFEGLLGLKFTRGAEEEADRLGVQYLYAAGYDPTGMATMFEKLAAKNKKKTSGFARLLMSHPDSLERRDESLSLVARFPEKEEYIISTSEFQRVKSHLMKITNAKAGVTTDINEDDNGKPTLKRREPEPDSTDSTGGDSSSSSSSDGPPKLKKRGDPEPTPSPTPQP